MKASVSKRGFAACAAVVAVVAMTGFTFYSVRLYKLFCQQTGFAGTPRRGTAQGLVSMTNAQKAVARHMTVRFDSNVDSSLPWTFRPNVATVDMVVGVPETISYHVKNKARVPIDGTAVFNVTPPSMGAYFVKIQCFCFTKQTLAPGEEKDMPVTFYLDPRLAKDSDLDGVTSVTLSYTFFPKY